MAAFPKKVNHKGLWRGEQWSGSKIRQLDALSWREIRGRDTIGAIMSEQNARHPFSFRPSERLHKKGEFNRIFREGKRFSACGIRFIYVRTESSLSRLGLAVGRKAGGAVRRNRIRRLLKEGFRVMKHTFPHRIDVVALPIPYADLTLDAVKKAFTLLSRALREKK